MADKDKSGTDKASTSRGAWLKDSRFGMFIHWGLYSELAGEWNGKTYYGISEWIMNRAQIPVAEYEKVAERFNPTGFNAKEWVQLAKDAGMRHIMITSKHHDGFAMFQSAASPYNIVDATPFKRDPLKELSEACRAGGVRLGFYYSQTADWHERNAVGNTWDFPEQRDFQSYLQGKAIPQIKELLSNYGQIAGIWFDTPGPITPEQSRLLVDLVHERQPGCLVNSRIGNNLGDYDTLGDQEIPRLPRAGLWETPDTSNDTWAFAEYDINWKSPTEIAQRLVRVVSRGGTYLLNVGPNGKGKIPDASGQVLREVGRWVAAHEKAIHGSDPTPLGPLAWGECTASGNILYLHVFHWPADGRLVVPGLKSAVRAARLMDGGQKLEASRLKGALLLRVPKARPDSLIPVVAVAVEGPLKASRDPVVLNGAVNILESGLAELSNCKPAKVHWMEKFGDWKSAECIGEWQGEDSSATWSFQTVEPGEFYLTIEYTAPAEEDYLEWQVSADERAVTFPLIDTGERPNRASLNQPLPRFRTYRVGRVQLASAGAHKVTLRPTGTGKRTIRVSNITLTPFD